jgi:DNA-binding MarR family transcriptional regulator
MNADIESTLIDIALWLYHAFSVPGDQFLSKFPELDVAGHGRVVSGLLSAAAWLGAILLIVALYRLIRDLDRTLTAFVRSLYEGLQRAWRVVARRLGIAFRSYALERQARLARTEVHELPALSGLQLQILLSHADLPPAHLLTPSDIARDLDMRSADVEVVVGTLRKLGLIERTLGADEGEHGYRLTRPGEVFLAACRGGSLDYPAERETRTPLPQHSLRPKRMEPTLGSM